MNKLTKILVPVLALALLLGAMVGITASANENTTPEIASKNVAYSSQLYLYYAVPVIDDNADDVNDAVVLNVYSDAECSELLYTVNGNVETIEALGGDYYVFITSGVAAKELNTCEYVQAVNTETGAKSAVVEYSVEKYLYERLYDMGYALMTEEDGEDFIRRTLYYDLLKYGNTAQQLFAPDAADKIADGNYFGTSKGFVKSGFYDAGAKVTLKATDSEILGWKYGQFTAAGELIESAYAANGSVVTLSGQIAAVPVYDTIELVNIDFDSESYTDYLLPAATDESTGISSAVGDGKYTVTQNGTTNAGFTFYTTSKNADANLAIFQADITINSTSAADNNIYVYLGPKGGGSSTYYNFFIFNGKKDGSFGLKYEYYYQGGTASTNRTTLTHDVVSTAKVGEKMTLRIEFYEGYAGEQYADAETKALTKVFVNGNLVYETDVVYGNNYNTNEAFADASNVGEVKFSYHRQSPGSMTFENVSLIQAVSNNIEFELLGVDPNTVTFDEMPDTTVFKAGLGTIEEGVVGENTANVETDETGNGVLHLHKGANGKNEEGTEISTICGMAMTQYVTIKEEGANVMIFDVDIKAENLLANDYIQIHVTDSSTTGLSKSPLLGLLKFSGTADGSVIKNQSTNTEACNTSAKVGEWFHLRIEYRVTATDESGNVTGVEYKFIINNDEPIVGTTIYKQGLSIDSITSLVFAFNNKNLGDYYIDNSSLKLVYEAPAAVE